MNSYKFPLVIQYRATTHPCQRVIAVDQCIAITQRFGGLGIGDEPAADA
jgi:hypothetical protein